MNMALQLLLFMNLLLWLTPAFAFRTAKPGCEAECGNITVPYPFGTRAGCARNEYYTLTCNKTNGAPPQLFLGQLAVLNLTLQGELSLNMWISFDCYDNQGKPFSNFSSQIWLYQDGPFSFSQTHNMFTMIGCNAEALLTGVWGPKFMTGCLSFCGESFAGMDGSCNGVGCCQTSIPEGIKKFHISFSDRNVASSGFGLTCKYAFLVDQTKFSFSVKDLIGTDFWSKNKQLPVVVDWVIQEETCQAAEMNKTSFACVSERSECYQPPRVTGYRCRCLAGYDGNPYLEHGCQDIDECEEGIHDCERKEWCINTAGAFNCSCPDGTSGDGKKNGKGCMRPVPTLKIILAAGMSCLFLVVAGSWMYWMLHKRKLIQLRKKFFKQNGGFLLQQLTSSHPGDFEIMKIFTSEELRRATDNYHPSKIVGQGGHGTVYKGILPDRRVVAIKKSKIVDESQVGQFINEIVILYRIHHRNVVQLLGCCLETEAPALVYEFIDNDTLYYHIHHENHASSLSLHSRLRIAAETAGALAFLHSAALIPIIHRDVKSTNILLDNNYVAKVSDFGASRLVPSEQTQMTTIVQGTLGYMDPEYFHTGQFTDKSDVYSFGVVLVELLTGEKPIRETASQEERCLTTYFISAFKENRLFQVLERRVQDEGNFEQLMAVAELAERCLKFTSEERPTMKEVAAELEKLKGFAQHPWVERHKEETEALLGGISPALHGDSSGQYSIMSSMEIGR